jgi:hypothetical protein
MVSTSLRLLNQPPPGDSKLREGITKIGDHLSAQLFIAEVSQRSFIEFRVRQAPD